MTTEKVNITIHLITEWFQINRCVSNKNKIFGINFSLAKTLTNTLNIILDNRNLTLTDSIKFLGIHLVSNVSWTSHMEKLLKKLSIACYMIRNLYYYLNLDSLFCILSVIVAIWDTFLGLQYKST